MAELTALKNPEETATTIKRRLKSDAPRSRREVRIDQTMTLKAAMTAPTAAIAGKAEGVRAI